MEHADEFRKGGHHLHLLHRQALHRGYEVVKPLRRGRAQLDLRINVVFRDRGLLRLRLLPDVLLVRRLRLLVGDILGRVVRLRLRLLVASVLPSRVGGRLDEGRAESRH